MSELPRLNFTGSTIKSEAELNLVGGGKVKKEDTSPVFKPGIHQVTVTACEYVGANKADPDWGTLKLTLNGTGKKQILTWVDIPLKDVMYKPAGKKPSSYPFTKFRTLAEAVGVNLKVETLADDIVKMLGKGGEKLVGRNLSATIGYSRAYVDYAGKDNNGQIQFKVVFPARGKTPESMLVGPDAKVMTFPDRDSAREHCIAANIATDSFPRVLNYAAPIEAVKTGTDF